MAAEELWHYVEARRDDGSPTMFRIRELATRPELSQIFVVEVPYPTTEMSRLPDASAHRRLAQFEEQFLRPSCAALGWEFVGSKTEDGSFFLYMYGSGAPSALVERLSPFDGALSFYDDHDPTWSEYATLRELLDHAKTMPPEQPTLQSIPRARPKAKAKTKPIAKPKAKPKAPKVKPKAKAKAKPNAKPKKPAKPKPKQPAKPKPKPAKPNRRR